MRRFYYCSVSKNTIFYFLTRRETLENVSEFVKPISSAYMGTLESGLADSRKIQSKCGISRIFSLFCGNGESLFFASFCGVVSTPPYTIYFLFLRSGTFSTVSSNKTAANCGGFITVLLDIYRSFPKSILHFQSVL